MIGEHGADLIKDKYLKNSNKGLENWTPSEIDSKMTEEIQRIAEFFSRLANMQF